MKKARFEELLSSVKQATEVARGARALSWTFEVNAATIKERRSRTKLSQPEFAALLGVELSTLLKLGTGATRTNWTCESVAARDPQRSGARH